MPMQSSRSRRLYGYNYSKAGAYFITICTKDKQPFFGTIESGELNPTAAAIITQAIWNQIPVQFPFVELDEFVVMPDHIHGIIILNESPDPAGNLDNVDNMDNMDNVDNMGTVGTRLIACPLDFPGKQDHQPGGFAGHQNPMFHQNLSRIIRWFKGRCSYEIRRDATNRIPTFEWQSNFHDHIIRDTESYHRICKYIRNNPENWRQ